MATMTYRERIITACRRQQPDHVPYFMGFERGLATELQAKLGTNDLAGYFGNHIRDAGLNPSVLKTDFSRYFTREDMTWDEWGRGRVWDDSMHYAEYFYPLDRAESVSEIEAYPWPDVTAPYRYEGIAEKVAAHQAAGYAVIGSIGEMLFEVAWQLRSMDRLFEDMYADEAMAEALLEAIISRKVEMTRGLARAGVDILLTGDDVAMQTGLMMSKDLFNRWLRPAFERIVRAAKEEKPDIFVWYHSDGKINDLIPDLIAAGMDILNPVQPECVDHRWVKATYGDKIAFSGGLGVQSIIPFGTPDEVRAHVKETIDTLGAGGGLLLAPSHVVERDTPLENILAMAEAMEEYGWYR
ncbi:MAG: uroporphyrinogen decarboxylase family protein [Armatimonadota bacterium]